MTTSTVNTPAILGAADGAEGPWNPGIRSELPSRLLPLSTLFRPENVFTPIAEAGERRDLVGLSLEELVAFRPERLAVHEVLIRVTADLSVPDPEGASVADLGINFRRMTHTILTQYVAPRQGEIVAAYDALRQALGAIVHAELSAAFAPPPVASRAPESGWRRWLHALRGRPAPAAIVESAEQRGQRVLREWSEKAAAGDGPHRAAYRALVRVMSAIQTRHGRLWGDPALLAPIATDLACNDYGPEVIGRLVEPVLLEAARVEGYRLLPAQARPVVMNTKGASASGKSTLRPLQRQLAVELGLDWSDFALISPDIWRKYLLDYDSLGDAYKYAGTFTGKELALVDAKLDRYMARKAERAGMSHLLIDRFRFDSFAPASEEAGSNLLTRFGRLVYLFFLITPPDETVERSWKRGLDVGRYKAVDDLLAHNVEAYTGMPNVFFTWAKESDRAVHYEFLDNRVPLGETPRTVAFGWNGEMTVLDVSSLLDIERYRKIDVNATSPEAVYPDGEAMAPENNVQFLVRCARTLPAVNFADRDTGRIYARLRGGRLVWIDPEALAAAMENPETRAGLAAAAPGISADADRAATPLPEAEFVPAERFHTLGQWNGARRQGP